MISYPTALELILAKTSKLETEQIHIEKAYGRVCASVIISPMALPSYNNSAMDGFALSAQSTQGASESNPVWLESIDVLAAGDVNKTKSATIYNAVEIMTGAAIPQPYDSVIPVENIIRKSEGNRQYIGITKEIKLNEHVRFSGEDFLKNAIVLEQGERINNSHLIALYALGIKQLEVFKQPQVLVVSTGKELAKDDFDHTCNIYDCNGPYLQNVLEMSCNAKVERTQILTDDSNDFIQLLNSHFESSEVPNIIISTGAVSAGKYDFIPESLKSMKAQIIFHKVAIRPGKPILFAILENGSYYFGLPGNPSAAAAGMRFFVYPLLRALQGMKKETPILSRLEENLTSPKPLCFFKKAYHYVDHNGESKVKILPGQESFKVSSLSKANSWSLINAECNQLEQGSLVSTYLIL